MHSEFCAGSSIDNLQVRGDGDPIIMIGQRLCEPTPSATWRKFADHPRFRLVMDLDDDLLNVDPENRAAHQAFSDPDRRRRLIENLSTSHLVTVSTEPLAEQVRRYNPNVVVIPNYVDAAALTYPRPDFAGPAVGWAGSSTHHGDFDAVRPALRRFYRAHPQVWWSSFGHNYGLTTGAVRLRHARWRDIVESPNRYYECFTWDIGVAPLADTLFNASKSHLKALEYASMGIPAVASDLAPYRDIVVDGVTGFLASTPRQWADALALLARDEDVRRTMGEAARRRAAEMTIQGNIGRWVEALASLG
jgi:glycosyltransferase involved in cell wall biosynthesis